MTSIHRIHHMLILAFVAALPSIASASPAGVQRTVYLHPMNTRPLVYATVGANKLGVNAVPHVEAAEIRQRVASVQRENGNRRAFHGSPSLAAVRVTMKPLPGLSPELETLLQGGLFSKAREGLARFSHGHPNGKDNHQIRPDVRGLAMNFAIGGHDGKPGQIATLSATNQPAQILPAGIDFLRFFDGPLGPLTAFKRLPIGKTLIGTQRLLVGTLPIEDLLTTRYWAYPIVVGQDAKDPSQKIVARVVFMPEKPIGTSAGARLWNATKSLRHLFDRHYLTHKAEKRLERENVGLTVGLQFYRNEKDTPLHADGDKRWNVPVEPVALLTLQRLGRGEGARLRALTQSHLAAGPQIVPDPQADLSVPPVSAGAFQGSRLVAYPDSQTRRGLSTTEAAQTILSEINRGR